jgi:hypothetical protein
MVSFGEPTINRSSTLVVRNDHYTQLASSYLSIIDKGRRFIGCVRLLVCHPSKATSQTQAKSGSPIVR